MTNLIDYEKQLLADITAHPLPKAFVKHLTQEARAAFNALFVSGQIKQLSATDDCYHAAQQPAPAPAPVASDDKPVPATASAKPVNLSAGQIKVLEFLAKQGPKGAYLGNKTGYGQYSSFVHQASALKLNQMEPKLIKADPMFASHVYITDAGIIALAAVLASSNHIK